MVTTQGDADRATTELRKGMHLLAVSAAVLLVTMAIWLGISATHRLDDHHGNLLPLMALIPVLPALYHLARTRTRR
jgi:hypothetical protein